jgi:hypothetical protein
MDILEQLANQLNELKAQRAEKINDLYSIEDYGVGIQNAIIADVINLMEQLFLIINMPEDGFVSNTPEQPRGSES